MSIYKPLQIVFLLLMALILSMDILPLSYGQSNTATTVNTTVKISICGDLNVEGPEDCEGSNLNSGTCSDLGFSSGNLTCDIACSYDTTSCIPIAPTPLSEVSNPSKNDGSSQDQITTQVTSSPLENNAITPTSAPSRLNSVLPPALQVFDISGSGRITRDDLPSVLQIWLDEWKAVLAMSNQNDTATADCDINNDTICDMRDLSILLYYVEQ